MTDPAIPIRAALPVESYRSLLDLAARELADEPPATVRLAWDVTEGQGATVRASVQVLKVAGGTLEAGATLTYTGRWTAGGSVQWRKD